MTSIVLGNEYLAVDATITAIMVREMIEGVMFCVTHIGAVLKNTSMSADEKRDYLKVLLPAVLSGSSTGLLVSVAIGVSIAHAVGDTTSTAYGIEVGEAVSRLIGAFFVTDLTIKIPKWFQISNYKPKKKKLSGIEGFGQRWEMGFSLWWNVLRECIEGGTLTAVAVILNESSQHALGNSVGVAIAATVALSVIFGFGAKYISSKIFGVLAAFLAQILAMGLWTGMARSFEEVYALNLTGDEDEGGSPQIYNYEGTTRGDSLSILEFLGFSYSLSALTLSIWLIALVLLSLAQYWHNYLGRPFLPDWIVEGIETKWQNTVKYCKSLRKKEASNTNALVADGEVTKPNGELVPV